MRFTLSERYSWVIAVLVVAFNLVEAAQALVPEEWREAVRYTSLVIGAVLLRLGYNSNPDGNSNRVAYTPKLRQR